jgi:hypothetical protein
VLVPVQWEMELGSSLFTQPTHKFNFAYDFEDEVRGSGSFSQVIPHGPPNFLYWCVHAEVTPFVSPFRRDLTSLH